MDQNFILLWLLIKNLSKNPIKLFLPFNILELLLLLVYIMIHQESFTFMRDFKAFHFLNILNTNLMKLLKIPLLLLWLRQHLYLDTLNLLDMSLGYFTYSFELIHIRDFDPKHLFISNGKIIFSVFWQEHPDYFFSKAAKEFLSRLLLLFYYM